MDDSFTAGQRISDRDLVAYESAKRDQYMVQSYVRYVGENPFDQVPYMRVTIGSIPNIIKNNSADSYPEVQWLDQPGVSMKNPLFSEMFKVYKDQREVLNFNYQLHFISNRDDLFIHKGFTKYLFKNPNQPILDKKPILVAFTNNIRNKDVIEEYTELSEIDVINTDCLHFDLYSKSFVSTNDYTGLAIIWPDTREILLEIKKPIKQGEIIKADDICFNFSNEFLK